MNCCVRLLFVVMVFIALGLPGRVWADRELRVPLTLRPGVNVTVAVLLRDPAGRSRCSGPVVVALHGLAHTGATWAPLVDEMIRAGALRRSCGVAVLDLPGRGRSGMPSGLAFGELRVDDYVTVLLGVLPMLRQAGLTPRVLLGHSLGGLIIEAAQARLLAAGQSLRRQHGVVAALLMSPSPAAEHPWAFVESGQAAQAAAGLIAVDPEKGLVLRLSPTSFLGFFFSDLQGQVSPAAPTEVQVRERGYMSDEPVYAGSQLLGVPPFARLSVGSRPFAPRHGTQLLYFNPSQDPFNLREEAQAAYVQLTGDPGLYGFVTLDDSGGVHDMHVSQPALYLRLALLGVLEGL